MTWFLTLVKDQSIWYPLGAHSIDTVLDVSIGSSSSIVEADLGCELAFLRMLILLILTMSWLLRRKICFVVKKFCRSHSPLDLSKLILSLRHWDLIKDLLSWDVMKMVVFGLLEHRVIKEVNYGWFENTLVIIVAQWLFILLISKHLQNLVFNV